MKSNDDNNVDVLLGSRGRHRDKVERIINERRSVLRDALLERNASSS